MNRLIKLLIDAYEKQENRIVLYNIKANVKELLECSSGEWLRLIRNKDETWLKNKWYEKDEYSYYNYDNNEIMIESVVGSEKYDDYGRREEFGENGVWHHPGEYHEKSLKEEDMVHPGDKLLKEHLDVNKSLIKDGWKKGVGMEGLNIQLWYPKKRMYREWLSYNKGRYSGGGWQKQASNDWESEKKYWNGIINISHGNHRMALSLINNLNLEIDNIIVGGGVCEYFDDIPKAINGNSFHMSGNKNQTKSTWDKWVNQRRKIRVTENDK